MIRRLARISHSLPVVITGASSGLGVEFARHYASLGHTTFLIARRTDRLEALATELRDHYSVDAHVITADLSTPKGVDRVAAVIEKYAPLILINNAGFGLFGKSTDLDPARLDGQILLNIRAVHTLGLVAARACEPHRKGGILNVASSAAFQPIPYLATYSATKAFVEIWSEGLAEELRPSGIRVMALCPGPVATEFGEVAGANATLTDIASMSAASCVRIAVRSFEHGRVVCVPGFSMKMAAASSRFAPRIFVRKIAGRVAGGAAAH